MKPHLIKINNEVIDRFLLENKKTFFRLEDSQGSRNSIMWKCKVCGCEWRSAVYNIIKKNTGCHRCNKREVITNEKLDECLKYKNIKRIEDVRGARIPISFMCLKHNHIWKTPPSRFVNKHNIGCPKCLYKGEQYTEEIIKKYFSLYFIESQYKLKLYDKKYSMIKIDFFIKIKNKNYFIEYNGKQHYEPCTFGRASKESSEKKFVVQQKRDKDLAEYCEKNNINLVILPYSLSGSKIEEILKNIAIKEGIYYEA